VNGAHDDRGSIDLGQSRQCRLNRGQLARLFGAGVRLGPRIRQCLRQRLLARRFAARLEEIVPSDGQEVASHGRGPNGLVRRQGADEGFGRDVVGFAAFAAEPQLESVDVRCVASVDLVELTRSIRHVTLACAPVAEGSP